MLQRSIQEMAGASQEVGVELSPNKEKRMGLSDFDFQRGRAVSLISGATLPPYDQLSRALMEAWAAAGNAAAMCKEDKGE